MNSLDKTEEEKMLEVIEELAQWFEKNYSQGNVPAKYIRREGEKLAISHANTQHSKIIEDYNRIARVAEKQAEEIERLSRHENAHIFTKLDSELAFVKDQLSAANATIALLSAELNGLSEGMRQSGYTDTARAIEKLLSNTQAATDAFMAEHDAKVLEGLADWFNAPEQDAWEIAEEIRAKATELRASANRKDE